MFPIALRPATRCLLAALALTATTACDRAETPLEEAAVVTVSSDTLYGAALRDILLRAPIAPVEDAAIGAVSIWADLALVVDAVAAGGALDDDATLAAMMRPAVMERTVQRFGETRAGGITPTADQVDSVARGNNVRVFRRYVIAPVNPADSARVVQEGRRLMQLREQAIATGSAAAAMRAMGAAAEGITVTEAMANSRQEIPEALAATIWRLGDNEMSEPIIGNGGVQLFERVPAAEAPQLVSAWLVPVLQRRADATYIDSVVASRGLVVAEDGASRMRAAAVEPGTFASETALATWSGGDLSPAEARHWLGMMPAPERARMRAASDTSLTQVLGIMARREILFDLAVASGIDPATSTAELLPGFREQLAALVGEAQSVGDPTTWFFEVLEGRRQFVPLPGSLAAVLRERTAVSVDEDARRAALQEAARTWQPPSGPPQQP